MPFPSSPVCSAQVPTEVKEEIKEERDIEAQGEDRRDKAVSEMAQSWALSGILDGVFSNTRGREDSFLAMMVKHTEGQSTELTYSRP